MVHQCVVKQNQGYYLFDAHVIMSLLQIQMWEECPQKLKFGCRTSSSIVVHTKTNPTNS
jgi:hypothetical protein